MPAANPNDISILFPDDLELLCAFGACKNQQRPFKHCYRCIQKIKFILNCHRTKE